MKALFVILEDHCGPPFCLFAIASMLQTKKKAVGYTYIPLHEFFLQCLFLYVRTLQIQFRKRVISKNACIFQRYNTFAKLDL